MSSCLALIVAAGRGDRFGGDIPKQYLRLGGRSILRRTVDAFRDHPAISDVQVVIQPAHREMYDEAVAGMDLPPPIYGAASRQGSTRAGLEAWSGAMPGKVLIHDAVRPFADHATIERVLKAWDEAPAAVPGLVVTDTLRRGTEGLSAGTVDRAGLWRMQTPQGFDFATILAAHRATTREGLHRRRRDPGGRGRAGQDRAGTHRQPQDHDAGRPGGSGAHPDERTGRYSHRIWFRRAPVRAGKPRLSSAGWRFRSTGGRSAIPMPMSDCTR